MTETQYLSLCEKYLNGTCTLQEEQLIKNYQEKLGIENAGWDSDAMGDQHRVKMLLQSKLQQSMQRPPARIIGFNKWWYAAAVMLLFASIGAYFLNANKTSRANITAAVLKKTNADIRPGSNKAVLTLSNGKNIVLDSAANGLLSQQGGAAISKSGNGITIKSNGRNDEALVANTVNTITILRGGKYDITLPDGTKVWLNSSSSLTFPGAFVGNERKVTLTGEAYFEVAKNPKMPFKVNVNNKQVVEVLGTHFNIAAYTDDRDITTTLLEGSVKVNYQNSSTLIKPGQMAVNNLTTGVAVKPADIEEVMAWKNGMFIFNNENIVNIMKSLSRWYDVDIAFKGDMSKVNFTGNYSRDKSLSNMLKNIELMEKVHCVVEGRRVTIIGK